MTHLEIIDRLFLISKIVGPITINPFSIDIVKYEEQKRWFIDL